MVLAAEHAQDACVRALLTAGASRDARDINGSTALMMTALCVHFCIIGTSGKPVVLLSELRWHGLAF